MNGLGYSTSQKLMKARKLLTFPLKTLKEWAVRLPQRLISSIPARMARSLFWANASKRRTADEFTSSCLTEPLLVNSRIDGLPRLDLGLGKFRF